MTSPVLPVVLCIDVEPDGRFVDRARPEPWRGFERSVDFFEEWRSAFGSWERDAARFTWVFRLDPQISETYGRADWALREYRVAIARLQSLGDEIGIHTHGYRWSDADRGWTIDHANQPWIEHCIHSSFDAYAAHFGRPAHTFRFGDRWMNDRTLHLLERLGVRYELTIEPGHPAVAAYDPHHPHTGALPDYAGVPHEPYRPSREAFLKPDLARTDGLWIMPVTTAPVQPVWWRQAYRRVRGLPTTGVSTALISHTPELFQRILEAALDRAPTTYLNLVVRSGALGNARQAARVRANLDYLRRRVPSARILTPESTMRCLAPAEAASRRPRLAAAAATA